MEKRRGEIVRAAQRLHEMSMLRRIILQKMTQGIDLHFGQLRVVEYSAHHDGCTQAEVAQSMMVTPASMALTTKRLEKAGLLQREVDESNQRCKRLSVTARGHDLAARCRDFHDEFDQRTFDGFSEEELAALNVFLGRMICNITGEDYPPQDGFVPIGQLEARLRDSRREREEREERR